MTTTDKRIAFWNAVLNNAEVIGDTMLARAALFCLTQLTYRVEEIHTFEEIPA